MWERNSLFVLYSSSFFEIFFLVHVFHFVGKKNQNELIFKVCVSRGKPGTRAY